MNKQHEITKDDEKQFLRWLSRNDFRRHSSKDDLELLGVIRRLGFKAKLSDMPKLRAFWKARLLTQSKR